MKNKKNILFVMSNLHCGGAEKSLISLLQTINYDEYNVDLQLFSTKGLFLKQVHSKVTILPQIEEYQYFDMSISKAVLRALKTGSIAIAFNRIAAGYIFKTEKRTTQLEQKVWKYISKGIKKSSKTYDAAFGFLEKSPIYYVVEKIQAKRKIGFIHNDYEKLEMNVDVDNNYFPKLDYIVTDSNECKAVLAKNFPNCTDKLKVIFNIVSPLLIHKLAEEQIQESFEEGLKIVSIGRLEYQKGYDFAIDALKIVKEKGINFHWIILGEGIEKSKMLEQILENNLQDNITFLGIKENHYPYVKLADIFMQTSRFEGKSIAIDEAKILSKPILVTNFSTVHDQITDKITGSIAEINPQSIAERLIELIQNKELRDELSSNLSKLQLGTESEIEQIYNLIY